MVQYPTPARLRALPSRLINQVAIAADRLTDRALSSAGSRRHHFAMLAALDEFGPSSQANLGRCTGIDRSDVAAAVDTLIEQRYVDRSSDPTDGRRNIITITAAGTEHLERLNALLADTQDELLRSLSVDECNKLIELLTRIIDHRGAADGTRT
jgi:DNA-binding MarR family transcriptional regulator